MTIKEELANCTTDEEKKELLKKLLEKLLKELKPKVQGVNARHCTVISDFEERFLNERIYTYIGSIVKSLSSDKDKLDILLVVTKSFCNAQKKSMMHTVFYPESDYWKDYLNERKNSFLNMKSTILKSLLSFENNDILNEIEEQLKQLDSLIISKEDMDSGHWSVKTKISYELIYNILSGLDEKYKEYNPEIVKTIKLRQNEITLEGVETYGKGMWLKCNSKKAGIEKQNFEKYLKKGADPFFSEHAFRDEDNYLFVDNNGAPHILINTMQHNYSRL